MKSIPEYFGSLVFDDSVMKERLPEEIYEKLKRTIDALLRRGHTYGQIQQGLRNLELETDDFPEES